MKKIFLLLLTSILGVSCVSDDMIPEKLDFKQLDPFESKMATIKEDYKTIIKVDNQIICETSIAIPYLIEKGKTATVEYQLLTKDGYENGGYAIHQFMAMFEDTRNGDNDYNDFVSYITVVDKFYEVEEHFTSAPWYKRTIYAQPSVYIQPLALGASKDFEFGIKFPNGEIWMATPNSVRADLFDSKVGYINVDYVDWPIPESYLLTGNLEHLKKHTTQPYVVNSDSPFLQRINPFIVINPGDTLYLAIYDHNLEQNNYNNVVNAKGYPYGIALPKTPWTREKINISTAYRNFESWIQGTSQTLNINDFDATKLVNSSVVQSQVLGSPQSLFSK